MMYRCILCFLLLLNWACQSQIEQANSIKILAQSDPSIEGKVDYLRSPFVTSGDRVYLVGHQDGRFPELGWHIKGEMSGIWNHPIKLMDGFEVSLKVGEKILRLDQAVAFVNYPFYNKHEFDFETEQLKVERWQFVPDQQEGLLVQLQINNEGATPSTIELEFSGYSDLRPTWLGERTQMVDGQDEATFEESLGAWVIKDSKNEWFTVVGGATSPIAHQKQASNYSGKGIRTDMGYALTIPSDTSQIFNFIISGSYQSKTAAIATFENIRDRWETQFKAKQKRYKQLANQSKLTIPDKQLQQTFEWLKYNADWMIRTVPEVGTGIMAGIPDYPWWFGVDSEYALKGYMAIGQEAIVLKTIVLLDSISNAVNGNGRIVHEVSSNGAVFNKGNINETPQFASLIWEIYRWNSDQAFLQKYFPTIQKGLKWLMEEMDANGNLFPEGFGMMEIHGLDSEMIDVAAYTQRAFVDAAKIAVAFGETTLANSYTELANQLKQAINDQFWSAEFQSYADFIGTDEDALRLIEDAIVRADTLNKPWAVEELERTKATILANPSPKARPFVLHHNWVVNTPMEMKIAERDKALIALKTAERFVNPFGVFVTGIDRDESAGTDDGSFEGSKVFSYTGAVMTLPTSVQAIAEANYGRPDESLAYIKRMAKSFSYALPGSMYEVSPDYGMMAQAWNVYGFAVPIVQHFFGVQPDAANRTITIVPNMPTSWATASLENIQVGSNNIRIVYEKKEGKLSMTVEQSQSNWEIRLQLPKTIGSTINVTTGILQDADDLFIIVNETGAMSVDCELLM